MPAHPGKYKTLESRLKPENPDLKLIMPKSNSWYCMKVNIVVHLCRMTHCEHYSRCMRSNT